MRAEAVRARIRAAFDAALEKKADGVEVLDLRGLSSITDYFLICHGNSRRQVQAIVEEIQECLGDLRVHPDHVEGNQEAEWVLMDYIDFVVHVFTPERRAFYGLERLWADAPHLEFLPKSRATRAAARRRLRSPSE